MRLEHGIVIGAEMSRRALPMDRGVKHAAHVESGDGSAVDADTDQTTRELVHHHEHPIAPEHDRLAAKQVHAPEAVLVWPMNDNHDGPLPPGDGR